MVSREVTPGQDKLGIQAAFDAGDNIGIHPVSDNRGVLRMDAQHFQSRTHHQRIRLST